ncbi:MAG TPA: pitrilysin family protein [Acidobacteriaceae bacterium]
MRAFSLQRTAAALLWAVGLTCAPTLLEAQAQHTVIPADASQAKQHGAWESIPVPPLREFKPVQPRRIELKNGAVLLLVEDHELPFISGSIEMHGGERDVPAAKAGLTDLYGDAWRTSGSRSRNGDQLDDLLEAKAAKIETGADIDSTSISWSCLKQDEPEVFGLMLDVLQHPAFSQQKLALAQQQAVAGIVRRNDSAGAIAGREAARLVYGSTSPYARQPEIATIMGITVADLEQWHAQTTVPNRMVIGVFGDFDAAAMEASLRKAFETLPAGKPAQKAQETFAGPKPGLYLIDKQDVNQSDVYLVSLGTRRDDPDYYTLSVMNEIFGGGFGSRLFQDVRTKLGLAYSIGGGYGAGYDHPGIFRVVAQTKSESTTAAAEEMLKDTAGLKTEPFTTDELRMAKDQLLNSFIFNYDSREKVLGAAARLEFYGYPADFLARYQAGVERVTLADLERVARQRVDPSKLAVLVVGNQAQFGRSLAELKLGTPQPIDITIPIPPEVRKQMMGAGPAQ